VVTSPELAHHNIMTSPLASFRPFSIDLEVNPALFKGREEGSIAFAQTGVEKGENIRYEVSPTVFIIHAYDP
jgi:hypothetical protein